MPDGDLQGIQFTLSASVYNSATPQKLELEKIGYIQGMESCEEMTLSGALDRIDIAYAPATGISGIKFYRGGNSRAIGNVQNEVKSW